MDRCVLLCLLVLPYCSLGFQFAEDPRTKAFRIPLVSDGVEQQTVKLSEPDVECTFRYKTSDVMLEEDDAKPGDILSSIVHNGNCLRDYGDYWTVKVCLGQAVTQFHDDEKFELGTFVKEALTPDSTALEYAGGDVCDAVDGEPARQTRVEFACGVQLAILEIVEPQPCSYTIRVSSPDVCGSKLFPQHSGSLQTAVDVASPWFLQVKKVEGGRVHCLVESTGWDEKAIVPHFKQFDLFFSAKGADSMVIARTHNLKDIPSEQIRSIEGGVRVLESQVAARRGKEHILSVELYSSNV